MGLKARLKSRISVDIVNFLLINILLRHIEQKLYSILSFIDWFKKNRPTGLKACLDIRISVDIDKFLLVNILLRHIEQNLFSGLSSID